MLTRGNIFRKLTEAYNEAKQKAALRDDSILHESARRWSWRQEYTRMKYQKLLEHETEKDKPQRIFVSFNADTGKPYFDFLTTVLSDNHFEVVTGFDEPDFYEQSIEIGSHVESKMRTCPLFLSIMTSEHREKPTVPTYWVLREEGMALVICKGIVRWVHESVDPGSVRPFDIRLYESFNDMNYKQSASRVVGLVFQEYQNIQLNRR